jgi:hypothetical protein
MNNENRGAAAIMAESLTDSCLNTESQKYQGTGGNSQGNGEFGFTPAFKDTSDNVVYLSRYSDGRIAKVHILDGMPEHLIISKQDGSVKSVKKSVISGFVLANIFYTRDEAARLVNEEISKTA